MRSKTREETPGLWLEQAEDRSWGASGREGPVWGGGAELSLRRVECGTPVPHPGRDAGQQLGEESAVQTRCLGLYPLKILSVQFQPFLHADRDRGSYLFLEF